MTVRLRTIGYLHLVALGYPPIGRAPVEAGRMADDRRAMKPRLDSAAGRNDLRIAAECATAAPSGLMCFEAEAALHGFERHHFQGVKRQACLSLR